MLRRAFRQAREAPVHIRSNSAFFAPMARTVVPWHGCGEPGSTNQISRISGVTIDITDRKEAEERQSLLAR
jgi:hypothetical protein